MLYRERESRRTYVLRFITEREFRDEGLGFASFRLGPGDPGCQRTRDKGLGFPSPGVDGQSGIGSFFACLPFYSQSFWEGLENRIESF